MLMLMVSFLSYNILTYIQPTNQQSSYAIPLLLFIQFLSPASSN